VRIDHATLGSERANARCAGTVPRGAPGDAALRTSRRDLRRAGLTPVSISLAKPLGTAPIVIAQTSDPAARLGTWQPHAGLQVDDRTLEGIYIEVRDRSGRVVFFAARSTRCRTGLSSVGHGVQFAGS
jgi:hypothetical protein